MKEYGYHPTLGIAVRSDGMVLLRGGSRGPKPSWTYGYENRRTGYRQTCVDGKVHYIHRLVAETFIPNPENLPEVDHINRIKTDNRVDNLRWSSVKDNRRNSPRSDRVESRGGTHTYEDSRKYQREYYYRNHDKFLERNKTYTKKNAPKRKKYMKTFRETHKSVRFADGSFHWLTLETAAKFLKMPVAARVFIKE